jgi:YVTN family beta-propeller protein
MPKGVSLSPDGATLYVTHYGMENHGNVGIFDAGTLRRTGTIHLPGVACESAVSPDGRTLYVSNYRRDSVQFVDVATGRVRREVPVGGHPKILVLSQDGARLFAANWGSRSVTELATATSTVVRTLRVGTNPRGMAFTRAGTLYVANFNDHTVDVFAGPGLASHHRIAPVCRIPRHLALSPDDRTLYVSCMAASELWALDTATEAVTQRVSVGDGPKSVDVSPDGRWVATADYRGSGLTLVDTTDWTTRVLDIPWMDHASGVAVARTGLRFYVTGWYDNHVFAVEPAGGAALTSTPAERARVRRQRVFHARHPIQ